MAAQPQQPAAAQPHPFPHAQLHAAVARIVAPRPQDVLEPSIWPASPAGDDGAVQWTAPTQVRLRSVASTSEAVIEFVNDSDEPVRAIWLDFSGNEVYYTVIEPKGKRRYRTYVDHPWIIRAESDGRRMMLGSRMVVLGAKEPVQAHITTPPALPWTFATHKFFPASFKEATRTLLLCHHRLQQRATAANNCQPFALSRVGTAPSTRACTPLSTANNLSMLVDTAGCGTADAWHTASSQPGADGCQSSLPSPAAISCPLDSGLLGAGSQAKEGCSPSPHPDAISLASPFCCAETLAVLCGSEAYPGMSHASAQLACRKSFDSQLAHPALMCVEAARTAGAPSTIPPSATSTAGDEDMPDQDLGAQGEQDQDIGEAAQSRLGSFAARSRSVSSSISGCASSFAHQALQASAGLLACSSGTGLPPVPRRATVAFGKRAHRLSRASGGTSPAPMRAQAAGTALTQMPVLTHVTEPTGCLSTAASAAVGDNAASHASVWNPRSPLEWLAQAISRVATLPGLKSHPTMHTPFAMPVPMESREEDMSGIAALPSHLLAHHVLHLTAPSGVFQCVSRGPAGAYPGIQPACLVTDPSSWPPLQAAPFAAAQ